MAPVSFDQCEVMIRCTLVNDHVVQGVDVASPVKAKPVKVPRITGPLGWIKPHLM